MTIRKGAAWGMRVPCPPGLPVAAGDAELARMLAADPDAAIRPESGDLVRTMGGGSGDAADVLAVSVDTVELRLDGGPPRVVVAHVVVRREHWRGGFLRGPVVIVMNAEFRGSWQVAPRGHPNDGRVEVLECASDLGVRQRLAVRRRLHTATHLPHPGLRSRSVTAASWRFDRPSVVIADGRRVGRARQVEVRVRPDAAMLYV